LTFTIQRHHGVDRKDELALQEAPADRIAQHDDWPQDMNELRSLVLLLLLAFRRGDRNTSKGTKPYSKYRRSPTGKARQSCYAQRPRNMQAADDVEM